MKPHLRESPLPFLPRRCHITHLDEGRFFDCGESTVLEPRVYLHAQAVESMARELGMRDAEECARLEAERDDALDALYQAREELKEADRTIDAIHVIEGKGFKPKRKPGPKAKQLEKAA